MSRQLIDQLLFRAESESLDFKSEQYVISRDCLSREGLSPDEYKKQLETKKSELLKDLLAMANSWRTGSAYILVGVLDSPPAPPEVVGIPEDKAFDDAELQQFVAAKVEGTLKFSYETLIYQEKVIGLFTIPEQDRPVVAKADFGVVKRDIVYVRRGSSTATATSTEIGKMGAFSAQVSRRPKVQLRFLDDELQALGGARKSVTLINGLEGPIEDYEMPSTFPLGLSRPNKDFLRELRDCNVAFSQGIPVLIEIENSSEFSLTDCELHISASQANSMVEIWDIEKRATPVPESSYTALISHKALVTAKDFGWVSIPKDTSKYSARIPFGYLRPGEEVAAKEPFLVLPKENGAVKINCRLLSHELPEPLLWEVVFDVSVSIVQRSIYDLESAYFQAGHSDE